MNVYEEGLFFEFGKVIVYGIGCDLMIIVCGLMVYFLFEVVKCMVVGLLVGVIDMVMIKFIDCDVILKVVVMSRLFMIVEEYNVIGGFGVVVVEVLVDVGVGVCFYCYGIYDEYVLIVLFMYLYCYYKFDIDGIEEIVIVLIGGVL